MNAEIISVGTELLMGQIVNTDAQHIARRLTELGINCFYQITVGDNHDRLAGVIRDSLTRCDVLILTGGLGPTGDDMTKEVASEVAGRKIVQNDECLRALTQHFALRGYEMTPNNKKQAFFPEGAIILPNPNGTAPGCVIETGTKAIVLLPGPPSELVPMFDNHVFPYLEKKSEITLYSRILRIFGIGESSLEYKLKAIIDTQTNPTVAPYALSGEVTLRITAKCHDEQEGRSLVEPMIKQISGIIGEEFIYSTENRPLHEVCFKLLKEHGLSLALAESCTGGMLASEFVSLPGSSDVLKEGLVTYSDNSKATRLGVSEDTLVRHGAVSDLAAREMAIGAMRTAGADIAISTTGFAGPGGGTSLYPVGTVFVALADRDGNVYSKQLKLDGARDKIRHSACLNAWSMLRTYIIKNI